MLLLSKNLKKPHERLDSAIINHNSEITFVIMFISVFTFIHTIIFLYYYVY